MKDPFTANQQTEMKANISMKRWHLQENEKYTKKDKINVEADKNNWNEIGSLRKLKKNIIIAKIKRNCNRGEMERITKIAINCSI